jgi:hypothetical protein
LSAVVDGFKILEIEGFVELKGVIDGILDVEVGILDDLVDFLGLERLGVLNILLLSRQVLLLNEGEALGDLGKDVIKLVVSAGALRIALTAARCAIGTTLMVSDDGLSEGILNGVDRLLVEDELAFFILAVFGPRVAEFSVGLELHSVTGHGG